MVKKVVNGVVRNAVAEALDENRDYTASELKKHVEKTLKKKGYEYRFTERTYLNLKKELAPKAGAKDIDMPWTIGACVKANIPADIIPWLLAEQAYNTERRAKTIALLKAKIPNSEKQADIFGDSQLLTIRQAQWYTKLFPTIMSLAYKQIPDSTQAKHTIVFNIARLYAHRERVSETLGMEYPDTSDMDVILAKGDFTSDIADVNQELMESAK